MKKDGRHLSWSFSLILENPLQVFPRLPQHNLTLFTKVGLQVKLQSSCPTVAGLVLLACRLEKS